MQAFIFCFFMPVIPILIWKSYNRNEKIGIGELAARYVGYTLIMTTVSTIAMGLFSEEGTSFLNKMDASIGFAVKFAVVQFAVAMLIAAAEWALTAGRGRILVDRGGYAGSAPVRFFKGVISPCGLYILAAFVICLNVRLIQDNVLWGDEAFSANTVRNGVSGIMQIVHFWDSHPPLYYLWLRLWVNLLGDAGWVLHLASLIPFIAGVLVAVTLFKKRFGNIPAAFFVIISGLSAPCLEYNLEVRMYALCFFAVLMAFYCGYRVICGGKMAWFCMVLWALVAAYSHYYGLVTGGILIVITAAAATVRFKRKTFLKGILAVAAFVAGYSPWLAELYSQTKSVHGNWWNTTILPLEDALNMAGAGSSFRGIVLGLLAVSAALLIVAESDIFRGEKRDGRLCLRIEKPSAEGLSAETYTCVSSVLIVAATLGCSYLLCVLVNPILAGRYLYMLIAITSFGLMAGSSGILKLLQSFEEKNSRLRGIHKLYKLFLVLVLFVLLAAGMRNYKQYSSTVNAEAAATQDILAVIGEPDEDTKLVNCGVTHIGWTVLSHYYPENEILNEQCTNITADRFWYFCTDFLSEDVLNEMSGRGYAVSGYGERQLVKYPLVLYYFEKQ